MARNNDPLELDARREIYTHLREYPGLHLSELSRTFDDLAGSTVRYHLDQLSREGLLNRIEEDGYVRFYPRVEDGTMKRDTLSAQEKRVIALLRQEVPLGVVLHLLSEEEAAQGELAEAVGVAPSTLHHHLKKLRKNDIVGRRRDGRRTMYYLEDPVAVGDMLYRFEPPPDLADTFAEVFQEFGL